MYQTFSDMILQIRKSCTCNLFRCSSSCLDVDFCFWTYFYCWDHLSGYNLVYVHTLDVLFCPEVVPVQRRGTKVLQYVLPPFRIWSGHLSSLNYLLHFLLFVDSEAFRHFGLWSDSSPIISFVSAHLCNSKAEFRVSFAHAATRHWSLCIQIVRHSVISSQRSDVAGGY